MIRSDVPPTTDGYTPPTTDGSGGRRVGAPARAVLPAAATLLAVLAVVLAALAAQRPPAAVGAGAAPDRFSAERAVEHLRVIAREPHAVGTAAAGEVRDYLVAELGALGLETELQGTTAVSERFGVAGLVENVLGRLRGSDPSGAILLVAHYDSVTTAPGAADNGAAVAAILEGLRALVAAGPLRNDVMVLFSDAEEVGLLGAEAFAAEHPWMSEVSLVVNLEARGTSGPAVLVETQLGNRELMRAFAAADPFPNASSMSFEIYNLLANDTDFSVFKDLGVPGYNFAFIRDLAHYHSERDDIGSLSLRSLQHHGEHVVGLTRHFGHADLGAPLLAAGDAVYFDVLRLALVHYPASLAVPTALLALLAFVVVAMFAHSRGAVRLGLVPLAAAAIVAFAAAAGLASVAVLALLARLEPAFGSVPMAAPYRAEITMAALALLGLLVLVLGVLLASRWLRHAELSLGAHGLWAILGLIVAALLPGGSYLFVWPVLGGTIALALVLRRTGASLAALAPLQVGVLLLGLLPALLLLAPFLAEAFIALGLGLAPVLVVVVALAAGLLLPLAGALLAPARAGLPVVLLIATVGLLVLGARSAAFHDDQPFPVNAFYAVDPLAGDARFLSFVDADDPWTTSFFDGGRVADVRHLLPDAFDMRSAPAPVLSLPVPSVELLGDVGDGAARRLSLRVASARDASQVALLVHPATPVEELLVNGRRLQSLPRPNGWTRLVVYGRMRDGVTVELVTRADADVELVAIDQTNDLFDHDTLGVPPRPPGMMPAPSRMSDAVLVARAWSAPPAVGETD